MACCDAENNKLLITTQAPEVATSWHDFILPLQQVKMVNHDLINVE
ncbi:MAG: hypothetical protein OQK77_08305 [Psychromonas sp.]|nr:hypothetical protein [Psychromonas sp.]